MRRLGPGAGPGSCLPTGTQGTAAQSSWGSPCLGPGCQELGGQRGRCVQRNSSYNTETLRHRHTQTHMHTHTHSQLQSLAGRAGSCHRSHRAWLVLHAQQSQRPFPALGTLQSAWVQGVVPASALGGPGLQRQLCLPADCRAGFRALGSTLPYKPRPDSEQTPSAESPQDGAPGWAPSLLRASGGRPDLWFTAGPDLAYLPCPMLDEWGSLGVTGVGWAVATARTWLEAWSLERRPHLHPGPAHLRGSRAGCEQCRAGVRPAAAALTLCQAPLSAPD